MNFHYIWVCHSLKEIMVIFAKTLFNEMNVLLNSIYEILVKPINRKLININAKTAAWKKIMNDEKFLINVN